MKTFQFHDTIEANLELTRLTSTGNLEVQGMVAIKQLNKNEVYEHLGYFHNLSKKLKLPYEPLLAKFKEHRLKLIKSKKGE